MILQGKRAVITGSSQGIGLAVARSFLRHGAKVVVTSHDRDPEIGAPFIRADISQDNQPEWLIGEAWNRLNGLDILVNNVGTFREPPMGQLTRSDFDRIFRLNVWSAMACSQAFSARLIAEKRPGRILFSSSLNGSRSEPGHTLYDASKGAIDALTRQLAVELAPNGITTAAVAPGLVETPLTDMGFRSDPPVRRTIESQIPIGRIATVEEIAEWYAFLASDAANYATGIVVPVCGGLHAQQMATRPLSTTEREALKSQNEDTNHIGDRRRINGAQPAPGDFPGGGVGVPGDCL
jgi:NAD(P)-dependent dehydrogenase (short-subunit alcohol dehydrogenase family)